MSTKDAAHYLANPDELTSLTDAQLEALAYGEETSGAAQDDTAKADPAPSGDAVASTPEAQNVEQAAIQARDGKHTIPYEVLASTRAAKEAAEAGRADLQAKLDDLQAKMNAAENNQAVAPEATITPEELAEMQENFPVMAKAYQAMQANLDRLQQAAVTQQQSQQAATQQSEAGSVQDLIDANPKLAYLQASDPAAWQRAIALDDQLRNDPTTASLPMADRFNKVAAMYEVIHGAIHVPAPSTSQKQQDVPVSKKPTVPLSMGAIPGGTPPPVDEQAALLSMDGAQATAHFAGMTKEQIERQLDALL